jgi:hypothetical protein
MHTRRKTLFQEILLDGSPPRIVIFLGKPPQVLFVTSGCHAPLSLLVVTPPCHFDRTREK